MGKSAARFVASGGKPLVQLVPVLDWCEEMFFPLRRSSTTVQQAMDCSEFETFPVEPLDKVLSLCPLSKKDHSAGYSGRGEADVEGDASLQRDGVSGVFGHFLVQILEFLGRFSKTLVWRCGFSRRMGCKLLTGLKHREGFMMGRVLRRYKAPCKGFQVRAGAFVHKPIAKRAVVELSSVLSLVPGAAARRASDGEGLGPSCSRSFADRMSFAGGCVSDPVVDSPSAELDVPEVLVSQELKNLVGSWLDFPSLPTSVSLVDSHRSEGPSTVPLSENAKRHVEEKIGKGCVAPNAAKGATFG
jgi:hypothetical protein